MKKRIAIVLGVALAAVSLSVAAPSALANPSSITVVGKNTGTVFVTHSGLVTSKYPGALVTGDRIFSQEKDFIGGKAAGFDDEACTVTFDGNDLCQDVAVLTGRGEIVLTYLLVGRNESASGPHHFGGIIDGGTGQFQSVRGTFQATGLANGTIVKLPLPEMP
jgi:hypothetical protein